MLADSDSMERKKSHTSLKRLASWFHTPYTQDFWHEFLRLYTFNFNDQFLKCGLLEIRTSCLARTAIGTSISASFVCEPGENMTWESITRSLRVLCFQ